MSNEKSQTSQEVAAPNAQRNTILDMFEKLKPQLDVALPKTLGLTPDRMIRVFVTCMQKTPLLAKCTTLSLGRCLLESASYGLELGSPMGDAYAVPFEKQRGSGVYEAQFMPGYRGLMKVARRSGNIATIYAVVVHAKDEFSIERGIEDKIIHRPDTSDDPGPLTHVYAVVKNKDGSYQFDWMTRASVELVRARSRARNSGPWVTDYEEMAKKSIIRRLMKMVDLSPEVQKLIEKSDEEFELDPSKEVAGSADTTLSDSLDALTERLAAGEHEREPGEEGGDGA